MKSQAQDRGCATRALAVSDESFQVPQDRPILFVASVGTTLRLFVSPLARSLRLHRVQTVGTAGALGRVDGFDRLYELPAFRRVGPLGMAHAYRRLYEVARAETPCLLHLHTPPALVLGRLIARRLGLPSIAIVHGTFLEPMGHRGVVFAAAEAMLARLSIRTVVVNDDDARFYRRFTPPGSVSVAPVGGMGIDLVRIRAGLARPVATGSGASIVVLGRLTAEKNLDMVVNAFKEVRRRRPSASLTFVGSAQPGDRPWKVPLGDGISHREWVADPYSILAGAELLVSASRREGFPMAVAEALVLGLPVVTVTNRGARQIQRTEHGRLTLVPNDTKALAEAMFNSLALTKLGAVDERLASIWSTQSAIRSHEDLIRNVLASRFTADR